MEQNDILELCNAAVLKHPRRDPNSLIGRIAPTLTGKIDGVDTVDVWIVEEVLRADASPDARPRSQRALVTNDDDYSVEALSQVFSFPSAKEVASAAAWEQQAPIANFSDHLRTDFDTATRRWAKESGHPVQARLLRCTEEVARYSVSGGCLTYWIRLRDGRVMLIENTMPQRNAGIGTYVAVFAITVVFMVTHIIMRGIDLESLGSVVWLFVFAVMCGVVSVLQVKWRYEDDRVRFDVGRS